MKVLQFPSAYAPGERPYDIFKDRMAAISAIVGGIKEIYANKYTNNQMQMIADNILNKIDEDKSNSLIGLINEKPPEDIYPANIEDTITQFIDKYAVGPAMRKEMMTGGLPAPTPQTGIPSGVIPTGTLPGVTPTASVSPTAETMVPKQDISSLYNAISGMPSGDVNWASLFKTMTEKKPWFMGPTGPEGIVMERMMGQIPDKKAELEADINLAKLVQETFYPKAEKPTEWEKKTELFLQTDPTVEEVKEYLGGRIAPGKLSDFEKKWNLLMERDHTRDEEMKLMGAYVTETTPVDINSILKDIPEGWELGSWNISSTGAPSFSFKQIDKTTPWEFDTWDEAVAFRDTHPQEDKGFIAKIETHGKGFDLTWYKETGVPGELKPITPSDIKSFNEMLFGDGETPGVTTLAEYEKVKDYIIRTKKDFPIPEYLEIAETNVGRCLGTDNTVSDFALYSYFYKYYKEALKGGTPKYLPPEMIEKTGFWGNKFGSALVEDYELDFAAMKKDGVTKEDIMKEIMERH